MTKIKLDGNNLIEKIELLIEEILTSGKKEIEFKLLIKIIESLGGEYLKGKKSSRGSKEKFIHELLLDIPTYTDGTFTTHIIHGGKANKRVQLRDFKKYFLPPIQYIIEMKKSEDNQGEGNEK